VIQQVVDFFGINRWISHVLDWRGQPKNGAFRDPAIKESLIRRPLLSGIHRIPDIIRDAEVLASDLTRQIDIVGGMADTARRGITVVDEDGGAGGGDVVGVVGADGEML
jgi:hypothetical protein